MSLQRSLNWSAALRGLNADRIQVAPGVRTARSLIDGMARILVAEAASSDASDDLCEIEDQIAGLSAASLAGLKLKARVAQRHDDTEVDWPDGLGAGLVRDVLALTEATASRPAAEPTRLVDQVDFTSATMAELLALRDVAERIGSLAYAHAWSPRCHRGKNAWGAVNHNVAGKLMNFLGDALTAVEAAAETEAKLRKPSDERDSTTRLYMLTPAAIDSGDPDDIEAFARQLLAYAEAERTRG